MLHVFYLMAIESRGCYASSVAKAVLKKHGLPYGIGPEDCYRIIQLAAANVFEPGAKRLAFRDKLAGDLSEAASVLARFKTLPPEPSVSIEDLIPQGQLRESDELDIDQETIARWNNTLRQVFAAPEVLAEWWQVFSPQFLLRNEAVLYRKILGE